MMSHTPRQQDTEASLSVVAAAAAAAGQAELAAAQPVAFLGHIDRHLFCIL
jgi:hypothetical protein